jgi:hypothetical protein
MLNLLDYENTSIHMYRYNDQFSNSPQSIENCDHLVSYIKYSGTYSTKQQFNTLKKKSKTNTQICFCLISFLTDAIKEVHMYV